MTRKQDRVRVFLRFRPLEKKETLSAVVQYTQSTVSANRHMHYEATAYSFHEVFEPQTPNSEIFAKVLSPAIAARSADAPISACLLAYGQTNSGKSFTIDSLLTQTFQQLTASGTFENLTIAATQIYNERVSSLLVTPVRITSQTDLEICLKQISDRRYTHETNMNLCSSRSHVIYTISDSDKLQLVFVDLAGSEKVGKTGVSGNRLEEAKAINKSLHALGNCVRALTRTQNSEGNSNPGIQFRESKLTTLLKNTLVSDIPVIFVCCASLAAENEDETISTLRFAQTAKRMRPIFETSEITRASSSEMSGLRALVAELEDCRILQAEKIHWVSSQHRKFVRKCVAWDTAGRIELPPWAATPLEAASDSASEN